MEWGVKMQNFITEDKTEKQQQQQQQQKQQQQQ